MIDVFVEAWWSVDLKTVPGAMPGTAGAWIIPEAALNQARARAGFAAVLGDPEVMAEIVGRASAQLFPIHQALGFGELVDGQVADAIRAALTEGDTP
jgi:hypothetical protein